MNNQLLVPTGNTNVTLPAAEPDLTLADLWRMLKRRLKVILATAGVFLLLGVLVCLFMKPRYVAYETVQLQKDQEGPLGLDEELAHVMPSDTLDYNLNLETQVGVLQSDSLALKTIEDLNLEHTYDFKGKFNPINFVMGLIAPKGTSDPKNVPLSQAPVRQLHALMVFKSHLTVKPSEGTRLITISYSNPDPKLAAAVVNHLVASFIDYNYQIRADSTTQASSWLQSQLADLKKQVEDSQTKVSQLQKDAQVYSFGDTDPQGKPESVSVVIAQLQEASTALSTAESNRIIKEAIYRSVQTNGPDSVSGLAGNTLGGNSSDVMNSMAVIQELRQQLAGAKADQATLSAKYGSANPRLQQYQTKIAALTASIAEETHRTEVRAKSDYEIAAESEAKTRAQYNQLKAQADALNGKAIEYTVAKQEATQNQTLYQDLYGKLKEAGALAGLRTSNISVVDPGRVPGKPATPNVPVYLGVSVVAGLFIGSGLAFFMDRMDNSLRSIEQVELELGMRPLSVLPWIAPRGGLPPKGMSYFENHKKAELAGTDDNSIVPLSYSLTHPNSSYTEALRVLRTSILLSRSGAPPQVLLVTSCQPGDGKSSMSVNFAVVLAQQGHKVLVVECDMRRPKMQRWLGIKPVGGLSTILANSQAPNPIYPMPDVPGVSILVAGAPPPYSAELLGSQRMKALVAQWRESFDFIILDCPPALGVTDPVILMSVSDLVLMLVRHGYTSRRAMTQTFRVLANAAKEQQIGVIVNAAREETVYEYYGYEMAPYGAETTGSYENA